MSKYIESKLWSVYVHTTSSKKRYIGITSRPPLQRWRNGTGYKSSSYFNNAIQKYGWDNISHQILFYNLSESTAKELEIELIRFYNTTDSKFGYNLTLGGDGTVGRVCSSETKKKISDAHTGKICSEEQKEKQRIAIIGKKHSAETKEKIRIGNLGNNNGRRVSVICITTGKCFTSAEDGAKMYGTFRGGILRVCKGKQISCGKLNGEKLIWKYKED